MKEEDIDKRIERVVCSVASKKASMAQWEADRLANERKRAEMARKWRTYALSAAATVAVAVGIGWGFYASKGAGDTMMPPSMESAFRSGTNEFEGIYGLIDSRDYAEALSAIDSLAADTVIDPTYAEARREYLRGVYSAREYRLTWLKIYVLLKSGNKAEAVGLLTDYANREGEHRQDARELLKKLENE